MDNLTTERETFVSHLECGLIGDTYEAGRLHGLSKAGKPLLVRYNLDALAAAICPQDLAGRNPDSVALSGVSASTACSEYCQPWRDADAAD